MLAAYVGYEYVRIRRTLAAADLPAIPLGVEFRYGAAQSPNEEYTVVVLGDSTAQGIGAATPGDTFGARVAQRLATEGRAVHVVNLGVSGAGVEDVLEQQLPRLGALEPDLVLLSVGANDVTGWTTRRHYLNRMDAILNGIAGTGARVAVLNVPAIVTAPLLPLPARWIFDVRTHRFNDGLRSLASRSEVVALAPVYEETREPFERDHTHFAADLYHPSSKGYALWADVVSRALR